MKLTNYYRPNNSGLNTFSRFSDELDRFFAPSLANRNRARSGEWQPAVDIVETPTSYLVTTDLPGIDPEAIDITAEDGVLEISGERAARELADDESASKRERRTGNFKRRFVLPDGVDAGKISANGRHGVLEIEIPKQEKPKPRKIKIAA